LVVGIIMDQACALVLFECVLKHNRQQLSDLLERCSVLNVLVRANSQVWGGAKRSVGYYKLAAIEALAIATVHYLD
jgi:hypothetical protein